MNPAAALVAWACALAALAAAGATWMRLRQIRAASKGSTTAPLSPNAPLALVGLATVGATGLLAFLASRFLATDLSYQYVFFYTARDVEWPWRLAGTWAGREGSLLLWATMLAWTVAILHLAHARAERRHVVEPALLKAQAWTRIMLGLFLAAFLFASAHQSPFVATAENLLEGRPDGNGLNPTLKSAFILIHPPMMFAAYALATVPLAAAFAHLVSGSGSPGRSNRSNRSDASDGSSRPEESYGPGQWSQVAMTGSRLGWLLMTFSLGLGALWAYYTLGFGGYWAWDPVEVANLLPWLAFTVYLHAQLHHARHGTYRVIGPFLAALPFLLTLFSTISTRSGLWVSVHAFTDPTETFNPDPGGRFLDILRVEPSLSFFVGLFLATWALLLAFWCHRLARDHARLVLYSRIFAALFAAFAAYTLVAPASAFSALMEVAWRASGGSPGLGLLGIAFVSCLAAALPHLAANETVDARRVPRRGLRAIDLRSLAGFSVLTLGLGLLILFLFHVASSQGGATARFYEERLPYLALPVLLGMLVFQGHQSLGRKRALSVAGAVLAVAVAAWLAARTQGQFRLAHGLLLGVPALGLAGVGFLRILHAGGPSSRRTAWANAFLLAAALLNLLHWLNPPPVRLGLWTWIPVWPAQALFGAFALAVLWMAVRTIAGFPPRALGAWHLVAGALAGFYIAAPLVLAAWLMRPANPARAQDRTNPGAGTPGNPRMRSGSDVVAQGRLRQIGLHGIHFAIALALLGYSASTYLKSSQEVELDVGASATVEGRSLTFTGARMDSQDGFPATRVWSEFELLQTGGRVDRMSGELHWEPAAQAHFPLPTTLRSWKGDHYLDVQAIHIAPGSPCLGPSYPDGAWLQAYRPGSPGRVCAGDEIDKVRASIAVLPGLGILWLALAVAVASMALVMRMPRQHILRGEEAAVSAPVDAP